MTRADAQLQLIDATIRGFLLEHDPCGCPFHALAWTIVAEMATGQLEDRAMRVLVADDQARAAKREREADDE